MNLLEINDKSLVEKTSLTRKLTLGGKTLAYPVYRVRLDQLFYNDQNDRIATWITQYKNENNTSLKEIDREEYNHIIEQFIIQSNPAAIEKTKNNIALVNQREPGVVLADGRIIDGNRRFTCLRLLHNSDPTVNYFETVILDATIENNEKQIKLLELAIQHGEEQRVDYNLIDLAMGAYHDIVETQLLTIEEYTGSTNEPVSEVRRRLETAELIIGFLEFMGVPKQYHIAREMQVYSVFYEMVPLMRKCETVEEREALKKSVYSNVMMGSFADHRKYIRNVKAVMDSGFYASYMRDQRALVEEVEQKKQAVEIKNQKDLQEFVKNNEEIAEDMQVSMDRSLLRSKKEQTKSKPSQMVTKSIQSLMDIDTRIVEKLSDSEKDKLKNQLNKLSDAVTMITGEVSGESIVEQKKEADLTGKMLIAQRHTDEPLVYCENENVLITNLGFSLTFGILRYTDKQATEADYLVYFTDENYTGLCPVKEFKIKSGETAKVSFSLNPSASNLKTVYLIMKSKKDSSKEAQQVIPFKISIAFSVDFDF